MSVINPPSTTVRATVFATGLGWLPINLVSPATTTVDPRIDVRIVTKETAKKYTDCGRRPLGSGSARFATTTITKPPSNARTSTTTTRSTNTPASPASPEFATPEGV